MSAVNLPHKVDFADLRNAMLRACGLDVGKFTDEALKAVDVRLKADLTDVVESASHYARRREVVTEDDVDLAISERNTSGYYSKTWKYCGMVGGAMFGTGVQLLCGIPPEVTALALHHIIAWGTALTAIGAIMIGLSITNE